MKTSIRFSHFTWRGPDLVSDSERSAYGPSVAGSGLPFIVVMTSTYVAFTQGSGQLTGPAGTQQMSPALMVGLRVGLAFLVAVGTSLVVEWQWRRHGTKLLAPLAVPSSKPGPEDDDEDGADRPRRTARQRLAAISETALHDFVDIMVFLILGALLAATTQEMIRHYQAKELIADLSQTYSVAAIGVMMVLAVLMCLCSEADAFVAAAIRETLPSAAKLSFLVLGPMLDIKLYLMYTRIFRPRLIWTIIPCVVSQVLLYCIITHYAWRLWLAQFPVEAP